MAAADGGRGPERAEGRRGRDRERDERRCDVTRRRLDATAPRRGRSPPPFALWRPRPLGRFGRLTQFPRGAAGGAVRVELALLGAGRGCEGRAGGLLRSGRAEVWSVPRGSCGFGVPRVASNPTLQCLCARLSAGDCALLLGRVSEGTSCCQTSNTNRFFFRVYYRGFGGYK